MLQPMPHYKDGSEAHVGDQVVGKLYNTEGHRAGTIISITPGSDSCNAMVAYVEPVALAPDDVETWREMQDPAKWLDARPIVGSTTLDKDGKPTAGGVARDRVPRMAVHTLEPSSNRSAPRFRVVQGENHGSAGPAFALFDCADYCAVNELAKVGPQVDEPTAG